MSDKATDKGFKMSTDYVNEARGMADFILHKVHRGPGDTVDAAMHRAERLYGAPRAWLHRLRYRRDLNDMPISAFAAIVMAFRAAGAAGERKYQEEKALADARNSRLAGLAALIHGQEDTGGYR